LPRCTTGVTRTRPRSDMPDLPTATAKAAVTRTRPGGLQGSAHLPRCISRPTSLPKVSMTSRNRCWPGKCSTNATASETRWPALQAGVHDLFAVALISYSLNVLVDRTSGLSSSNWDRFVTYGSVSWRRATPLRGRGPRLVPAPGCLRRRGKPSPRPAGDQRLA
jgi:hypothetical protein